MYNDLLLVKTTTADVSLGNNNSFKFNKDLLVAFCVETVEYLITTLTGWPCLVKKNKRENLNAQTGQYFPRHCRGVFDMPRNKI